MKVASEPVVFSRELIFPDTADEASYLAIKHWVEVGRQDIVFSPDWMLYMAGSAQGFVKFFTVRRNSRMVGYAVFIMRSHPHYKETMFAAQDALYLAKEERRGHVGRKFIKFCDDQLRDMGVELVQHGVTFQNDFGGILKRMGYKPTSTIYERRIR